MFIKKIHIILAVSALSFFTGCQNLEDSSSAFVEKGSLTVGRITDRSIDYSEMDSAVVSVYSSDFQNILKSSKVSLTDGSADGIKITDIPVGKNRLVQVDSYKGSVKTGYTIRALTDIKAGDGNYCKVSWDSSRVANVYHELFKLGADISSYSESQLNQISAVLSDVHPYLIDAEAIAGDFLSGSLKSSSSYNKSYGTVSVKCENLTNSYTVRLNDISSKNQTLASANTFNDVMPGNWIFGLYKNGELVKYLSIPVKSGKTTKVTVSDEHVPVEDTSKIKIHVPSSLNYNHCYAWVKAGDSVWPGTLMTEKDSQGNYVIVIDKTSTNVIFNNGTGGTAGNGQTADLEITSGGEYNYAGGAAGSGVFANDFVKTNGEATPLTITLDEMPLMARVSVTPSSSYVDSQSVTLSASNCTVSKYTVDGSNPKTSGTSISFTSSKTISVGSSSDKTGAVITVKVWGTDGEDESEASAEFTKIDKPVLPETPSRLGAYYRTTDTQFTIWSPSSSNVTVDVTPPGGKTTTYTCKKGYAVDGNYPDAANIYGVKVSGNLKLAEYQFKINGVAVRDPYGKMIKYDGNQQKSGTTASGTENGFSYTSYLGPTVNIVMDMSETEPSGGWASRPVLENRCDAIVYEVHVGDFTSDSTWGGSAKNAGKFPGMVETGTKYQTVKTGIDHLKELGVTHVQLLPFYDFATKNNTTLNDIYNWGYDPVNYNVPEDRYSTCPGDYVARVREVKEMVNEFHKNGIRVIMDVVYNHTFVKEIFNGISSSYYTSGDLSGCGNSVNTGIPMVSRFIRDSLEYWAEEYNLDGFRFDLIGIYHTSAVKDWGEYLNNTKFKDRNLLMYGEPWNGYATDPEEGQKIRMKAVPSLSSAHVGVFNGKYRQSLKGANDKAAMGYIFNANQDDGTAYAANIAVGLKGSLTTLDKTGCSDTDTNNAWTRFFTITPDQSINYMFAHDNLNAADKIKLAGKTSSYAKQINRFGHGILLTSQGIPFIHAGDEFLRTKEKGAGSSMSHNSYMAGIDTNKIDWSLKAVNASESKYIADMIALRKAHDGLRYRNGTGETTVSGNAVIYKVRDTDGTKLCIVVNPGDSMASPVSGTVICNYKGADSTTASGTCCTGTGVTVIKY